MHIKSDHWYIDNKANPLEHERWQELIEAGTFDMAKWAARRQAASLLPQTVVTDVDEDTVVITYASEPE